MATAIYAGAATQSYRLLFNNLSLQEQCDDALLSPDFNKIETIVAKAVNLGVKLDVKILVPLLRWALDTENRQALNLFFESALKDHFFIHGDDLMVCVNTQRHVHAYSLYGIEAGLIPKGIYRAPSHNGHTCWVITCIPPHDYRRV